MEHIVNSNSQTQYVPRHKLKKIPKASIIKMAKIKGKEHINHKGKFIEKRDIERNYSKETRVFLFEQFYDMKNKNEQDAHLSGLITLYEIKRRRSRGRKLEAAKPHSARYEFKIRFEGKEIEVCKDTLLGIHGITVGSLIRIQNHLLLVARGTSPRDLRGKNKQKSVNYSDTLVNLIKNHIKSFEPRQSRYSRRKNPLRFYLSEALTIKDMHSMFRPEYLMNIPYKIY
ncbi:hypothetical protein ABEB36_012783 [Hypothenemus hampei]|uniref:Uncharacterized protein n=1 Tax=Hypothenemus hampei TaxID=57062 RepID=A0ABD1ED24_HYPHA